MTITQSFVLPAGAVVLPVSDLPETLRRELQAGDDEFAISRPNSRTLSQIVDAEAAALIRLFENPLTIGQAVARHSRGRKERPEQLLEDAFPLLQSLILGGLLVGSESEEAQRILPSLQANGTVDGWTIIRPVQALEDTELYQARGLSGQFAALKIARAGCSSATRNMLDREAQILTGLNGLVTPKALQTGAWEARPYLLIEWCSGVDASTACNEVRRRKDLSSKMDLFRITARILDAYVCLHQRGVIHGDVHPRNIIVDRDERIKIIDFGLAVRAGSDRSPQRGGVPFFFEPEFARPIAAGSSPPLASMAGEQYAVASLLYLLLTGSYCCEFSLERQEMLRQIAEQPMAPFEQRGIPSWPEVERLLEKALSKDPAQRFASMTAFYEAWKAAEPAPEARMATPVVNSKLKQKRAEMLGKVRLGGSLISGPPLLAPKTSVNYGSAGIAYALYRIACAEEDAEMLALADVWSARSVREIQDADAFYNKDLEITPQTVGRTSIYHSAAGVFTVQALIAQARGDSMTQQGAIRSFLEVCNTQTDQFDVTLGRAGNLLACGFLLDAASPEDRQLRNRGRQILAELWQKIDGFAPIRECKELSNLGIAHGWAGLLYATLCWCASSKHSLPAGVADRLDQLAACAEPAGRGYQWQWDLARRRNESGGGAMSGWCNGSAGYVFLWTQAHKALGRDQYLDLAAGAAWNAWETPSPVGNLCCGYAGQAYAQLNMYRHTGDQAWLRRAHDLASAATKETAAPSTKEQAAMRPESLYKGDLGIVVLASDLNRSEHACMPLFEPEV